MVLGDPPGHEPQVENRCPRTFLMSLAETAATCRQTFLPVLANSSSRAHCLSSS